MQSVRLTATLLLLAFLNPLAFAKSLDDMDGLLGEWESSDGLTRVEYKMGPNKDWVTISQWFKINEQWQLVGNGAVYHNPSSDEIKAVTRTVQMGGIVMFETLIEPTDFGFSVQNTVYTDNGDLSFVEETWTFESRDRFTYKIYKEKNDGRDPWMIGTLIRIHSVVE